MVASTLWSALRAHLSSRQRSVVLYHDVATREHTRHNDESPLWVTGDCPQESFVCTYRSAPPVLNTNEFYHARKPVMLQQHITVATQHSPRIHQDKPTLLNAANHTRSLMLELTYKEKRDNCLHAFNTDKKNKQTDK